MKSEVELDFELLFQASPDYLLVLLPDSPRFTMVAATDARLRATHATREATMGRGLFEVFPDNPDETDATGTGNLRASLERVLLTREADTMAVQKYDIRGPDGSFQTKYWSPKNIPVLAQTGEVAYILHRVEDVTDLVEASELGEVLRDQTRQMERDVIARSRELAQTNQSLREANLRLGELDAAKSTFFSNVSHEFRTPLTLLLGPLENALARDPPAVAPFEIQTMHRNAVRLYRLVNSLLDFSRMEAGKMRPRFSPTDLSRFTAALASSFHSLMEDSGLRFVIDCPPLPEPVYVDQAQWEKIVLNLISNAFKFTFHGEIHVRLEWHGEHVELTVRDTGTGIPEGEIPHLFQRFHRIEGAKGRSFEGTGIGLALVQDLAQLHGGSCYVKSAEGSGSTFTVRVPTGSSHIPAEATSDTSDSEFSHLSVSPRFEAGQWLDSGAEDVPSGPLPLPDSAAAELLSDPEIAKSRILVVDDNTDMRNYVARLLSPFWTVETAAHGGLALEAARRSPPELVLSDVMMPVMDGVTLLAELRRDPRTSMIPVILLSARVGEDARIEGLETGADDYLVKPFSARELLARVNTHLTMSAVRRNAAQTERELAATRSQLITELEQTNRSLVDSYNQLATAQAQLVHSAKMASLGELVAGIAHEINNPLAFVKSHLGTVRRALRLVESDTKAGEPSSLHHDNWSKINSRLVEVEGGVERIQELIIKLRTFSRLDEGERKVASIRECVDSVRTILQHRMGVGVELALRLDGPDLVDCYPSLLNQALMNLVTNAIDAVGDKGKVVIASDESDGQFRLSVSDTGSGVPESLRQRILEPFFTTKPVGRGTGLGLSITYSIARKHGGTLEISDAKPSGAVFALIFPTERAPNSSPTLREASSS